MASTEGGPKQQIRDVLLPAGTPAPQLLDPALLLDSIEQMARIDARSGMYRDAFLASHGQPLIAEVRITEQLHRAQRETVAHHRNSRVVARQLVQELLGTVSREKGISAGLHNDLDEAQRTVDEQAAVLRGEKSGAEGGSWNESTALAYPNGPKQARRAERWESIGFYLFFGAAELFFSYLSLLLLGGSIWHTVAIAAIVGAAVLFLPKQAGREIAYYRAAGGRGHLVSATVSAGLAAVILIGLAVTRTKYVFHTTTFNGRAIPSTAADSGLDPLHVTLLWGAVSAGVAAIVLTYSALKTNPHRDAYRRALIRLAKLRKTVAEHDKVLTDLVGQHTDRVADAAETDALWDTFSTDNFDRLVPEAIATYRHHLARAFADPDITTALEVSLPDPAPLPAASRS